MNTNCPIYFVHYGIGWRDGVNTALRNLAKGVLRVSPKTKIVFIGGEIKEKIVKGADYLEIPELKPPQKREAINKKKAQALGEKIAKKLALATEKGGRVIIENPFLGNYHLPAMLAFSFYAQKYKPQRVKLFFRIHDLYLNSSKYKQSLGCFSKNEMKGLLNDRGVDKFFVVKSLREKELVSLGVSPQKIFYLPNGIDQEIFSFELSAKEKEKIYRQVFPKNFQKEKFEIILYPVRVVPRKNIEEAILLVYLLRKVMGKNYALVISGKIDINDPRSKEYYQDLLNLKRMVDYPVIFCKGKFPFERRQNRYGIGDLYQISTAIIMTCIEEGFGYPYLEACFSKKLLIGRKINDIMDDFSRFGLDFSWLYSALKFNTIKDIGRWGGETSDLYKKRIKLIMNILGSEQKQKDFLNLNRKIISQAKLLQDNQRQQRIIFHNLKAAQKHFSISQVTNKFLKLIS